MGYFIRNNSLTTLLFFILLLKTQLSVSQADTAEFYKYLDLANGAYNSSPEEAYKYALKTKAIAFNLNQSRFIARSYNLIGSYFYYISQYDSARYYHKQAIELQQENNDILGLGRSYTNLGNIYTEESKNDEAIKCFVKGEENFQKVGYKEGLAKLYNCMGVLFYNIKDYKNSEKYYESALVILGKMNDEVSRYVTYTNYASALCDDGKVEKSIEMYLMAHSIASRLGNYYDMATIANNLSDVYVMHDNYKEADKYANESIKLINEHHLDEYLKITSFLTKVIVLQNESRFEEALSYADTAISIARKKKYLHKEKELIKQKAEVLMKLRRYEEAFLLFKESIALTDSIYKKNLDEKLSEVNAAHNVEKKEKEIEILNVEKSSQKKRNILATIVAIVSLIAFIIAIYSYVRKRKDNRLIQHQKEEVEKKNEIIEHKQKEIIDSINYAKRLQEAILPAKNTWQKHLPQSFILYKPKDIVAGDFYWMERVDDLVLFAAADCTGHGVPGAMVSVVCCEALNRSVKEFGLTEPGKILDKTREIVIETFQKNETEVKDGMDISLCALSLTTNVLKWSGANNPLWILQNGNLQELKADKQPVGKYVSESPFTTHEIALNKGDSIFVFTDGYADQFGGANQKKMKYKKFGEQILQINNLNPGSQMEELDRFFMEWKGQLEQVDDVCVIGVKL